jgi:N-acetylneuraminic acid mutarotase
LFRIFHLKIQRLVQILGIIRRRVMNRRLFKLFSLLMVLALLFSLRGISVTAQERSSAKFDQGSGSLTPSTTDTNSTRGDSSTANSITWATKAPMLTARSYLGAAALNGKVYAVGGFSSTGTVLATLEVYDPTTNTWTAKASMPTARWGLGLAAYNGKLYAIGGEATSGISGKVEEYDPATDTWIARANMPTSRVLLAVAVASGKIYAMGGTIAIGSDVATVEAYDPSTNTWTTKASMLTARKTLAAATAANGRIYATGGWNDSPNIPYKVVEEYDPSLNVWASKANMPANRYFHGIALADNGKLYAVGGKSYPGSYYNSAIA